MRQTHRAGEKAFIDYSGKRPAIVDAKTGEVIEVDLFVMVLGASNYTVAEATRSQKSAEFTGSIVRGLEVLRRRARSSSFPITSAAPSSVPIATTRTSTQLLDLASHYRGGDHSHTSAQATR